MINLSEQELHLTQQTNLFLFYDDPENSALLQGLRNKKC